MKKDIIGIVVALEKEAMPFLSQINAVKTDDIASKKVYKGQVSDKTVYLIISGIGKVSSALSTQALIDKFFPDAVINFGTVCGIGNNVAAKKYYAIDKCCQYDFDLSDLDNVPVGYIQDYDTVFFPAKTDKLEYLDKASLATSDKFTCKDIDVKTVKELRCSLCDMEGASVAQVCLSNKTPLYIIKGVTDVFGSGSNSEQFTENLKAVSDGFPQEIIRLLNAL